MYTCSQCGRQFGLPLHLSKHKASFACRSKTLKRPRSTIQSSGSGVGYDWDRYLAEDPLASLLPGALGGSAPNRRADVFQPMEFGADEDDDTGMGARDHEDFGNGTNSEGEQDHTIETSNADGSEFDSDSEETEPSFVIPDLNEVDSNFIYDAIQHTALDIGQKAGAAITNRLLKIVTHPKMSEASEMMREKKTNTLAGVKKHFDRIVEEELEGFGYKPVWVVHPADDSRGVKMYLRSGVEVLKRQLKRGSATKKNFIFKATKLRNDEGEQVIGHPMSGECARRAEEVVKESLNSEDVPEEQWFTDRSFVCLTQIYSDKSAMSLSPSGTVFYPIHATVLNFTPSERDSMIRKGLTTIAYLNPASKWSKLSDLGQSGASLPRMTIPSKLKDDAMFMLDGDGGYDSQLIFKCCAAAALETIKNSARKGIEFQDADGLLKVAHIVVASWVTDMPEGHLLTSTSHRRCSRCEVEFDDLNCTSKYCSPRNQKEMEILLDRLNGATNKKDWNTIKAELWDRGYHPIKPLLLDWPFTSDDLLDLYSIIRYEHMHNMYLGLVKTIPTAFVDRMRDKALKISCVKTKVGVPKAMSTSRVSVLRIANKYIAKIHSECRALGFNVDFERGKKKEALDGFFKDTGVASMLEASDMRSVMQILPYVGALFDRMCGTGDGSAAISTLCTKACVLLLELELKITRREEYEPGFTKKDISDLSSAIVEFKTYIVEAFGKYQKSEFKTRKFHGLEHLIEDLLELGSCRNYWAEMYEAAHRLFKNAMRITSRHNESEMDETTRNLAINEAAAFVLDNKAENSPLGYLLRYVCTGKTGRKREPKLKKEVVLSDSGALTKRSKWSLGLNEIESAIDMDMRLLAENSDDHGKTKAVSPAQKFLMLMGTSGLAAKAVKIIKDKAVLSVRSDCPVGEYQRFTGVSNFESTEHGSSRADPSALRQVAQNVVLRTLRLDHVASGSIAGYKCPSLDHQNDHASPPTVSILDNGVRVMQKVVGTYNYYGTPGNFQDAIMVEHGCNSNERMMEPGGGFENSPEKKLDVWFAKVLCFLRVRATDGLFSLENEQELAVVQYFEVIPKNELDEIDETLGSVKLRWAVDDEERWIDVIPISSLRGRVHVVPAGIDASHASPVQSEDDDMQFDVDSEIWKDNAFYVNNYKWGSYDTWYRITPDMPK